MNDILKRYYQIEVLTIISISQNTYKIKAKQGNYYLKYVDKNNLEGIINKLQMLHLDSFDYIEKNSFGRYVTTIEDISFIISRMIEEDNVLANEIKIKTYINKIALLHSKSFFTLDVSQDFFLETYEYIENKLIDVNAYIDMIISKVEKEDYKSPFQWIFTLNYNYFKKSMDKAYDYLQKFKKSCENKNSIRMVMAYLNFDYNHIYVKEDRIISIEKMINAPPIFDLLDMVDKAYNSNYDLSNIVEQYCKIFPLQEYEKYWLLAILFIPRINLKSYDEINLIKELIEDLEYCKCIEKIENNLTK